MTLIIIDDIHASFIGSVRYRSLDSIAFSSRVAATYFIILRTTFFLELGSCDGLLFRSTLLIVHSVTLAFGFMFYMRLLDFLANSVEFSLAYIIVDVRSTCKANNHSKHTNIHNATELTFQ